LIGWLDQVAVGDVIQRGQAIQINDLADTDAYRQRRVIPVASVEIGHVHSALYAPLMKDDRLLGEPKSAITCRGQATFLEWVASALISVGLPRFDEGAALGGKSRGSELRRVG
jgi:hypothetical protein